MLLAPLAMLPLLLSAPADAAQAARPAAQAPATTATITVTDQSGAPLHEVRVNLIGALDRSGSTQANGTVKFDGLRPGTYRLRFEKEGYVLFERELEIRAKQPAPNPSVALTEAPAPPAVAAPEPEPAPLPPPGKAITVNVPDFIQRNFITAGQPQKIDDVSCSGFARTAIWQVREPWEGREHADSDALLYIVAGEGTLRLGTAPVVVTPGSFVQVPRGTSYGVTRRGRNPVIILATLVGPPCQ